MMYDPLQDPWVTGQNETPSNHTGANMALIGAGIAAIAFDAHVNGGKKAAKDAAWGILIAIIIMAIFIPILIALTPGN